MARRCRGREIRTRGQIITSCLVPRPGNNHLLSPKARYGKLLPKEKLLELGHIRKGSGPSNWWSLPRQQVFQSIHESSVTDRPTKELQVQDPKAFAGFCGLSVQDNTADILYSYSFQLKSNFRCSIKAVPLVCQSDVLGFAGVTIDVKIPGAWGFPGGAVVENLPANAGDTGSSPGLGRSHMPRSN